ncbi:Gldg family protein [Dyella lutea]|uniref:Gldg family protein n=1 Tax=Dyella lutea TaxID=2950441 RepID=A0ABT1FAH4_9GAMM|nr:Gldg family protein [Dyella lutea]MCP1374364.1 Gldg family protein [Dyella lutea]
MSRRSPSRRSRLRLALAALIVLFVALTLALSRWVHVPRVDLTADGLYTLSPGTVQIVGTLHRPLRLTLYFSDHAARDLPQLRSYEQRVREMLQEMVARSSGKLRLQIVDPVPYSDDEASAEGNGLTPLSGGSNGERVFFGLVGTTLPADAAPGSAGGKTLSVPFFDPARETFLEYDIAKLLYELNETSKPKIGLISSLPIAGNPVIGEPAWTVLAQLQQLFSVQTIDPATLKHVDGSLKVLLLVHPKHLSDDAQYALDQYVLGGGHLVVFVDPDAELDNAPFVDASTGVTDDHNSDLPRLFKAWGVVYDDHKVVLDRSRALKIELGDTSFSHPAMLGLGAQELNRNDAVTASLQQVDVSSAGYFDLAQDATTRLIPLLQTSAEAHVVPVQRVLEANSDPSLLLRGYTPDNTRYVLAARLRGPFASAFPERTSPGHLAESAANAEVILVADTDLLSDRLWVDTQSFLGQPMLNAFASNGDFVANLVDNLSGSSALLSIRGRSTSQRPFTRVQALQSAADQKFLLKKQELERELAETRSRLDELQPARGSREGQASAEQKREIEQFLQRKLAISKELRDVQHQLNAEIDALGLKVKFINIVVMPALVTLFGLLYGWRRTRRSRRRRG